MAFLDIVSPEGGVFQSRVPGGSTTPGISSPFMASALARGDVGTVQGINTDTLTLILSRGNSGIPLGMVGSNFIFLTVAQSNGFKVWLGSWVEKPAKVWLAGAWVQKPVKRWDGAGWQ